MIFATTILYLPISRFYHSFIQKKIASNILNRFNEKYNLWYTTKVNSKALYVLPYYLFSEVLVYKDYLKDISYNQKRFLFLSAIVNGRWADWFPDYYRTSDMFADLSGLLYGSNGWRPIWRTAYILEKLSLIKEVNVRKEMGIDSVVDRNLNLVLDTIENKSTVEYLNDVVEQNKGSLSDKARMILNEIRAYDETIQSFIKNKVI